MTIYCDPTGRPWPGDPDPRVRKVASLAGLSDALDADPDEQLVVLGAGVALADALACAEAYRVSRPSLGVLLVRDRVEVEVLAAAIRAGLREVVGSDDPAGLRAADVRGAAGPRASGRARAP